MWLTKKQAVNTTSGGLYFRGITRGDRRAGKYE